MERGKTGTAQAARFPNPSSDKTYSAETKDLLVPLPYVSKDVQSHFVVEWDPIQLQQTPT